MCTWLAKFLDVEGLAEVRKAMLSSSKVGWKEFGGDQNSASVKFTNCENSAEITTVNSIYLIKYVKCFLLLL